MEGKQSKGNRAERVRVLLEDPIAEEGLELLDVEFASEPGQTLLRLYIDSVPPPPEGPGVTVSECSLISRRVGDLLDMAEVLEGRYRLEVSSPGLYRPLRKPAHFEGALGQRVKVKTFEKQDGRRVFTGTLQSQNDGQLTLVVDGQDFHIPIAAIAKANLEPDLSEVFAASRKGSPNARR